MKEWLVVCAKQDWSIEDSYREMLINKNKIIAIRENDAGYAVVITTDTTRWQTTHSIESIEERLAISEGKQNELETN